MRELVSGHNCFVSPDIVPQALTVHPVLHFGVLEHIAHADIPPLCISRMSLIISEPDQISSK